MSRRLVSDRPTHPRPAGGVLATGAALLGWWFRGLAVPGGLGMGLRLILAGAACGLLVGWFEGRGLRHVVVAETSLPCPVLPPPAGCMWVPVVTTGYCPCTICCGPGATGITAWNRDVRHYPFGIAAAPDLIPPRALLDIPGYGMGVVDDTGGAMRQDARLGIIHLDLRFATHPQALHWGRRHFWIAMPSTWPAAVLARRRLAAEAAAAAAAASAAAPAAAPATGP